MGQKMTCPGCRSHTSDILHRFQENEPCPHCGLSAQAALEIEGVRRRTADEALKQRVEELVKEIDQWRRRAELAENYMDEVRSAIDLYDERRGEG